MIGNISRFLCAKAFAHPEVGFLQNTCSHSGDAIFRPGILGGNDVLLALPYILQLGVPGNAEAALSALAEEQAEEPGKVCCNSFLTSAVSQLPGGDLRAAEAMPGRRWDLGGHPARLLLPVHNQARHKAAGRPGRWGRRRWLCGMENTGNYLLAVKLSVFQGSSSHHQQHCLQVSLVNPLFLPVTWPHGRLCLHYGIAFGCKDR